MEIYECYFRQGYYARPMRFGSRGAAIRLDTSPKCIDREGLERRRTRTRQEETEIVHRAVNPPRLQILRIDREGMIDDVIMHGT